MYDNELSELSKSTVLVHLDECEHCRKEYEALLRTLKLAASAGNVELSNEFAFNVINAFRALKERKNQIRRKLYYYAPVAAAIIAALGVSLFFYEKSPNVISHEDFVQVAPQESVSRPIAPVQLSVPAQSSMLVNHSVPVQPAVLSSAVTISGLNETQRIISIISESNARILNIFENSIEGEISTEEFQALKDSIEDRRIVYYEARPNEFARINQWLENQWMMGGLETVSFFDSFGYNDIEADLSSITRFRIYKKE